MVYAVAGVTGKTGRVAAEQLLARGERIRVLVRDAAKGESWKARGAEVAVVSLDDAEGLTRALTGIRAAYLLVPPDLTATNFLASRAPIVEAIAVALERTGVHAVLLSSIGAQFESGTGPIVTVHRLERRVGKRQGVTFLRAGYFLDNWASVLEVARTDGVLPGLFPIDVPVEQVSTLDIGRVAVELLLDPEAPPLVELSGPQPYSSVDVAAAVSNLIGRPVQPVEVPRDQIVASFTALGISPGVAELYVELVDGAARGLLSFETGNVWRGVVGPEEGLKALLA